MIEPVLYLLGGLVILILAADWLTRGAAQLADKVGVSHIFIGLTVVAFGTSAPEIFVTVSGAINDSDDISMGNIIGSNVSNIGLILGVSAIIAPIIINNRTYRREILPFFAAQVLFIMLLIDLQLSVIDGVLLLCGLTAILALYIRRAREKTDDSSEDAADEGEVEELLKSHYPWYVDVLLVLIGLAGLGVASEVLIHNAVKIATAFGIPEFTIAATIIALGTSFPELATCVQAARRGNSDLALGNVVGSNIWNTLAALGVSSIFKPIAVNSSTLWVDGMFMLAITALLCIYLAFARKIGRASGVLFSLAYGSYVLYLYS